MLQVVIPISDNRIFFPKDEFFFPKPIIEVLNEPLIVQVIKQIETSLRPDVIICVIPKYLRDSWSIENIISLSTNTSTKFFFREDDTSGSLCSCLLASDLIENGEVVCINMDEIIDFNLHRIVENFRIKNSSAGLILYEASHPRLGYAAVDELNNVKICLQRKVISKYAVAGFYYFKEREIFINACSKVLLADDSCDNQFFITSSINQVILEGELVSAFKISRNQHHSLYSPQMIKEFEATSFAERLKNRNKIKELINIVIPAAGKGSRFSRNGWKSPKPFIDLNGKPMLQHVIDNLAIEKSNVHIILQNEHIKSTNCNFSSRKANNINLVPIDYQTSGTACTVLHVREFIENNSPLLIANSDQIVDFDCNLFISDAIERDLDGSILVFKDLRKDPKWSFVKLNPNNQFAEEVAEKKPISELATVGIYFFKSGIDFIEASLEMIKNDDRVNNEFYTCPVYNYLIKKNRKIGIYEIDINEMHGIGTPDDLLKYNDLMDFPKSRDQPT